jgi:hypothetical protein
MIIGICGYIGSGKDTIANILIEEYNFKKDSFASSLKDILSIVFNWDRKLLEGDTDESRIWRNTTDDWWSKTLHIPNLTPRYMLQFWGTDLIRKHFHQDIWVHNLVNRIQKQQNQNIVITDCRFPSEINMIKQLGGIIIRVIRKNPDWHNIALDASNGCTVSQQQLKELNIHESEWRSLYIKPDYTILNTGSLNDLKDILKELNFKN